MNSVTDTDCSVGFPIRTSPSQRSVGISSEHFAATHVLHRLSSPRHSPHALSSFLQVLRCFSSLGWLRTAMNSPHVHGLAPVGFPHSEISGSKPVSGSPELIAAVHVLLRLLVPRHSPCALFTFPSQYCFTIGHQGVFRLGGWSPRFPTGFLVPRGTLDPARFLGMSCTGLLPSMVPAFQPFIPLYLKMLSAVRNPFGLPSSGLACSAFARHYLRNL